VATAVAVHQMTALW